MTTSGMPTPAPERTWRPITAGILSMVSGGIEILYGSALISARDWIIAMIRPYGFPWDISSSTIGLLGGLAIVFGIVAVLGGVSAVRRDNWGLALAGAILALPGTSLLGILAIIFVALSRREFGTNIPGGGGGGGNMTISDRRPDTVSQTTPIVPKTWKATTAGILTIIAGSINILLGIAAAVAGALFLGTIPGIPTGVGGLIGIPFLALGAVSVIGGIFALQRRMWGVALAGAICAMFPPQVFVLGLLSIVFVSLAKPEFD